MVVERGLGQTPVSQKWVFPFCISGHQEPCEPTHQLSGWLSKPSAFGLMKTSGWSQTSNFWTPTILS